MTNQNKSILVIGGVRYKLLEFIFNKYDIQEVNSFEAESHIDNNIKNPEVFIQTNIKHLFKEEAQKLINTRIGYRKISKIDDPSGEEKACYKTEFLGGSL